MWPLTDITSHCLSFRNKPGVVPYELIKATSAATTADGPPKVMSSI